MYFLTIPVRVDEVIYLAYKECIPPSKLDEVSLPQKTAFQPL